MGLQGGDIDIEAYYRRYGPAVLRRCRRLLRDEEAAVDAMHDTFVELLRSRQRLTDRSPFGLVNQMATHVCLDRIRRGLRRPETHDERLLHEIAAEGELESKAMAGRLLTLLFAREQPSTRVLAVLHLVDGMTLEQVALEVNLSVSGVRKRLRALRTRLAELEAA